MIPKDRVKGEKLQKKFFAESKTCLCQGSLEKCMHDLVKKINLYSKILQTKGSVINLFCSYSIVAMQTC